MQPASFIVQTTGSITRLITSCSSSEVRISLDKHTEGKVYNTHDEITGRVEITPSQRTSFDEVRITLQGSVGALLDRAPCMSHHPVRTRTDQRFLELLMPIRESQYPQSKIAEAGRTYAFPFNFVVPQQLLPAACTHDCENEHVYQEHLRLPPSLGSGARRGNDMSPNETWVTYAVRVRVVKTKEIDGKMRKISLLDAAKTVQVVPASVEQPPMSNDDGEFTFERAKMLKKGVFSGKLGKINVSTSQPKALILPPAQSQAPPPTVMATVNLLFTPSDPTSQPPRLGGLTTRMKVSTIYALKGSRTLASRTGAAKNYTGTQQPYYITVPLSSRCLQSVTWQKHAAHSKSDSAISLSSTSLSDSTPCTDNNATYYTAQILVPVSLPATKTWLPTFHSCIISRIYALDFHLTIHTPGAGVPASTVSLRVPVQIAATGKRNAPDFLSADELQMELPSFADNVWRLRVAEMRPWPLDDMPEMVGLGDEPPTYEAAEEGRRVLPAKC